MKSTIIVNFGGPRSLQEVESFLIALLTDRDVIRTKLPDIFHRWLFSRIAKKRAVKVQKDYALIGGKSPIFEDTEAVAHLLEEKLGHSVIAFHRYLTATHAEFLKKTAPISEQTIVFPLFPQFSFATTGSIARFFSQHALSRYLRWIPSYASYPAFVQLIQKNISNFLIAQQLKEEETILLFSAHGIPLQFVQTGDPYQKECVASFEAIAAGFPKALSRLSYQSKFGKGEWLKPYTDEVCQTILTWNQGRKQIVIIPLSFTSDHVETLFEVEYQYLPPLREAGLCAWRLPAPNRDPEWIDTIHAIIATSPHVPTSDLIFPRS